MKIMATGGGTGGHVYPALAALDSLVALPHGGVTREDICWVGSHDGVERGIVQRSGYSYQVVSTGPLRGANLFQALASLRLILRGTKQSLALLRRSRPAAVLATGGFVSVPLVLAAWLRRVPAMLYLPDMEPGLAVKVLARIATRVAVSFEPAAAYFGGKAVVTGYPVRQALFEADHAEARRQLGIEGDLPLVLVMGGSRGARSINMALQGGLASLLTRVQVLHVTGLLDYDAMLAARQALPPALRPRYRVHDYLHTEMVAALAAADLVVARSGAATLGEFPAVGLPAILIPYPHAGQHQWLNAAYLADAGAALVLADDRLGEELLPMIERLLDDPSALARLSAAARAKSMPQAAERIAAELLAVARGGRHG
jgi:UDP-N-acetylglucosamine--N-acetylmuramyl-(pentapeptide) pyrophosphoryl-undecaprenol N-acetylglucosamine transferase